MPPYSKRATLAYIVRHNILLFRNLKLGSNVAKGLNIWILSTLTFISLAHAIDAAIAFFSGDSSVILRMYPAIGAYLSQMPTNLYLYASVGLTTALWGLTCLVAFNNPVEAIFERTLSECKEQQQADQQLVEEHSDFFDLMYQNMEECKEELGKTVDLVLNVRAEVKDVQRIKETFDETKDELANLRRQVKTMEEKMIYPLLCRACGKPLRADFSLCPYCGEEIKTKQEDVVVESILYR
jgi:hypothetical protein